MTNQNRRSEWTVLIGLGLVGLGIYLFLGSFAGWLVAPIATIIRVASRVIWPLVLIAAGVLLVLRARGGGWAPSGRRYYRSREDRMIAGVLGGAGKWLGVNPTPLRVVFAFFTFFTGFGWGILAYVLAALLLPEEPYDLPAGYTAPAPPPAPAPPASPAPAEPPAAPVPPTSPASPVMPKPPAAPPVPAAPESPASAPEPPAAPEPPVPPAS